MKISNLITNEVNQNDYHFNKLTRNKIGFLYIAPVNIVPDDCLACDGYVLKIVDYKKLHSVIGTYFNTGGETEDEFRVPDYNITGRFLQPNKNVGIQTDAGLPNIMGKLMADGINSNTNNGVIWGATGAFYLGNETSPVAAYNAAATRNVRHVLFSASNSSQIYGRSSTVQPPSHTVHICIKYK